MRNKGFLNLGVCILLAMGAAAVPPCYSAIAPTQAELKAKQPNYRHGREYMVRIDKLFAEGKLSDSVARFFSSYRPAEELYDLNKEGNGAPNRSRTCIYGFGGHYSIH